MWTFEDVAIHGQELPEFWNRAQSAPEHRPLGADPTPADTRPGFPPWNRAAYDASNAHHGGHSLALPTRGGSTSIVLDHNALPILPGADHRVSCSVFTRGLEHARARVLVSIHDKDGAHVTGSPFASSPIISEGEWTLLTVEIPGDMSAQTMGIELQLAQPDVLAGAPGPLAPDGRVWAQDLDATAWIDDLIVQQRPRISVTTGWPGEVVAGDGPPAIELRVRDTAGEALHAHMRILDAGGALVDEHHLSVDPTWAPNRWTPALPGRGWYELFVTVDGPGGPVGSRESAFIWSTPPEKRHADRSPLGIVLSGLDPSWSASVPALVRESGAGMVAAPVLWGLQDDLERLLALVDRLLDDDVGVTLVLDGVPSEGSPMGALQAAIASPPVDPADLALLPLFSRFGERVYRWQIGADAGLWMGEHESDALARGASDLLRRYVPSPVVSLAWDMHTAPPGWSEPVRTITPHLAPWPSADTIDAYIDAWRRSTGDAEPSIVIGAPEPSRFGAAWTAADMARRIVRAWAAGAAPIYIPQPWVVQRQLLGANVVPTPTLAVMRTLSGAITGVAYGGRYPAPEGVYAVFGSGGRSGGVLIAWSDTGDATLEGYFGDGDFRAHDIYANPVPIDLSAQRARIPLTQSPVIVTGIDPAIASFCAGLRVEPGAFGVSASRQEAEIVVENPWTASAAVQLRFSGPEAWDAVPRVVTANIRPRDRVRIPISLLIGLGELAGAREIVLEASVISTKTYPPFEVAIGTELGMEGLHALPLYRIAGDGGLVLEVVMTNTSGAPLGLDVLAHAPGRPTQESPIAALAPGQSMVRRFRFDDGPSLYGGDARISIRRRDSTERLNLAVPIR